MRKCNIRVYKVVFPDGNANFEWKTEDGRGSTGCFTIESVASVVKSDIKAFFKKNKGYLSQVSIDFKPFHEIECPNDLDPRRCRALTDEEAKEFWRLFNDP